MNNDKPTDNNSCHERSRREGRGKTKNRTGKSVFRDGAKTKNQTIIPIFIDRVKQKNKPTNIEQR